jgi:hypothetical protein
LSYGRIKPELNIMDASQEKIIEALKKIPFFMEFTDGDLSLSASAFCRELISLL